MHDAHAAHSHAIPAHHPHISPLKTYLTVYFALLGLTIVTVIVSYLNLGAVGLAAALVVAIVKATVVGMYFMHLKYDDRFNTIIVFASILFILLFFGLTFADLQSRGMISEEEDNHYMRRVKQAQALADKLQAQGAAPPAVAPAAVGHQP
ncbi:cytochrome C oxidase subunit IV family protein, partial [bacterium]|nr:cytochrome C oxidase subunit IV family protein [bacterium]